MKTSQKKPKFEDYDGFVEKFKPKKATDDCYTPPKIYDEVLRYMGEIADTMCLHFHNPKMYSAEKVTNGYQGYLDFAFPDPETGEPRHLSIRIKHVICTINEGGGRVEYFDFE